MSKPLTASISRRQFLRGDLANRRPALLPPWALAVDDFFNRCDRCGKCLEACEARLLASGDGGYPQPDFHLGACNFCGACAAACPTGALLRRDARPWNLRVAVRDSCLAARGIACQVCADHCPERALRFPPRLAPAVAAPVPDSTACNGCGACVAPCPVRAIRLTPEVT